MHRVRYEIRSGLIGTLGSIVVSHDGPRAMLFRSGTHMIDAIENGTTGVSAAAEARKTLQIMLGFLKSHQEGNRLVDVQS